jgi:hypothetical protein
VSTPARRINIIHPPMQAVEAGRCFLRPAQMSICLRVPSLLHSVTGAGWQASNSGRVSTWLQILDLKVSLLPNSICGDLPTSEQYNAYVSHSLRWLLCQVRFGMS